MVGHAMKLWCGVLFLFCSSVFSEELDPLKITEKILTSSNPVDEASHYFHKQDPVKVLKGLGQLSGSTCFLNHDSQVFDTVTCQVIPSVQKMAWYLSFTFF
jgi:hypothetical protein